MAMENYESQHYLIIKYNYALFYEKRMLLNNYYTRKNIMGYFNIDVQIDSNHQTLKKEIKVIKKRMTP